MRNPTLVSRTQLHRPKSACCGDTGYESILRCPSFFSEGPMYGNVTKLNVNPALAATMVLCNDLKDRSIDIVPRSVPGRSPITRHTADNAADRWPPVSGLWSVRWSALIYWLQ